jgi:hypothetical protein
LATLHSLHPFALYQSSRWAPSRSRRSSRYAPHSVTHRLLHPSDELSPPSYGHADCLQKYTVQPKGIYAAINRLFALDSNRSTGIPLNPQFRNPPPGALDPNSYDDPVTLPAADIAENPYWKRDVRRRYPRLSTITQADAVALLEVGSAAAPKQELIGDAGSKQLVAAQEQGAKGLSVAFERNMGLAKDILGPGGMPPMPPALHTTAAAGQKRYDLEVEQAYGDS